MNDWYMLFSKVHQLLFFFDNTVEHLLLATDELVIEFNDN